MGRHKKVSQKKGFNFKPSLTSTLPILCVLFIVLTFMVRAHQSKTIPAQAQEVAQVTTTPAGTEGTTGTSTTSGQNHPPILTTIYLPTGTVGIPYKTTISSWDNDSADNLTFSIEGLPENIFYDCSSSVNKAVKKMDCTINGTPTYAFTNENVVVTVVDNRGGSISNTYSLNIVQPTPTITPTASPTPTGYVAPSPAYVYPTWTPTP